MILKKVIMTVLILCIFLYPQTQKNLDKEDWFVNPEFHKYTPKVIAVVPMVNMSLEPGVGDFLQNEVYKRLQAKGYQKIASETVDMVMKKNGIQIAEQLSGISYARLGQELNCDCVLQGQVNNDGTQHQVIYDAVVVSCSLQLVHCETGEVLWRCEQFRTAHRQWQGDPFNLFINLVSHEKTDRTERMAWLIQEMFRTLPQGPIQIVYDDLLSQATEINIDITAPMKNLNAREDEETIQIDLSSDILFDFDKDNIKENSEEILSNLIPIIKKFPNAEVLIVGHTDSLGIESYNLDLSVRRAGSCKRWILERLQIENQTFIIQGKGETEPIASNDTPEDQQKNRRVEITIKKND